MTERATRIANQESGDWIATRSAYETFGDPPTSRVIQLIDWASRQLDNVQTVRGISTPVTSADPVDLNSLPSELVDNALELGDKAFVVVMPEHTADDGEVYITPIILDADNNVIGIRATKASGMGEAKFRYGASGRYASPQLQWDAMGAKKIGFHITKINGTNNGVVLKAALI